MVTEEDIPMSHLRIKSRKATCHDCTSFLRPGVEICVFFIPQYSKRSDEEKEEPVSFFYCWLNDNLIGHSYPVFVLMVDEKCFIRVFWGRVLTHAKTSVNIFISFTELLQLCFPLSFNWISFTNILHNLIHNFSASVNWNALKVSRFSFL